MSITEEGKTKGNKELTFKAFEILNEACEANRYRDAEIMQGVDGEKKHAITILGWVRKLIAKPSSALEIAALFHDVDRVVTLGMGAGFKGDRNSAEYQEHKKAHAKRSADFICQKLLENRGDTTLIERIRFLITHHDDIGVEVEALQDDELNTLVAGDGLSFFTSIAPKLYQIEGEERLKDKVRFMIEKMPISARTIMSSIHLENPVFERLKGEVLKEVGHR